MKANDSSKKKEEKFSNTLKVVEICRLILELTILVEAFQWNSFAAINHIVLFCVALPAF